MKNPYQAYKQAAARVLTPVERDAFALREAARLLREAKENPGDSVKAISAIQKNQLLWVIFIENAASPDCGHDQATRENIVNLGAFVIKQGQKALMNGDPEIFDSIISININLAEGLNGTPSQNPKASP